MKIRFLTHNPGNRSLILIFAGWSTGPELYQDAGMNGWDVAVVYDYSDPSLDVSFLDSYPTVWLFAWSLGVRMASVSLPPQKITAAFAINGTLNPVDNSLGIPEAIYNGTASALDGRNLAKFRRRMSPDADTFHRLFDREFSQSEIEDLRSQLYLIRDLALSANKLPWQRAFISVNDRIFPPDNMMAAWQKEKVETVPLEGAHYLPMESIVKAVVPDRDLIAERFGKAVTSYDEHAVAQKHIATALAGLMPESAADTAKSILEIGPGTGLFSGIYAEKIAPGKIDFVDIAEIPRIGIAPEENYHRADAEDWIASCNSRYDGILSASTIQWFVNIGEFMRNCRRSLKPGGFVLFSSFTKGNLKELDALRPSPICYHTPEQYRRWMQESFSAVRVIEDSITLEFKTPRELLMHLKLTGVGGSAPSPGITPSALKGMTSITYKPIYMAGIRK